MNNDELIAKIKDKLVEIEEPMKLIRKYAKERNDMEEYGYATGALEVAYLIADLITDWEKENG